MLEIKILISELDYDGVVELAAPLAAEKLAQKGRSEEHTSELQSR